MSLTYEQATSGIKKSKKPTTVVEFLPPDSPLGNNILATIRVTGILSDGMLSLQIIGAAGGAPIFEKVINNEAMVDPSVSSKTYNLRVVENATSGVIGTPTDNLNVYNAEYGVNIAAFGPGSKIKAKYAGNSDVKVQLEIRDNEGEAGMFTDFGSDIGGNVTLTYGFSSDLAGS